MSAARPSDTQDSKRQPARPANLRPHKRESISVKLTPGQKAAIEQAARRVGLDVSTWLRMVGLKEADWNPDTDEKFPEILLDDTSNNRYLCWT